MTTMNALPMTDALPMATALPMVTALPMAAPMLAPAGNPHLEALIAMFPEVEAAVLSDLLTFHKELNKVVDYLLDSDDDDVARRLQADEDAEVARAVHASLQAELKAEAEAKGAASLAALASKRASPTVEASAASRVMSSASLRAKWFMQLRARSSRTSTSSTHEARLLDAPLESDATPAYDMTPLQAPTYVPPPVAQPVPVAPAAQTVPAAQGAPRTNDPFPAADPALYNSRLDRARSANRVRTQSRLSQLVGTPPEAEPSAGSSPLLAPGAVPEGQLI